MTNDGSELAGQNVAAVRFERYSVIAPERTAILHKGAATGYGELNRRAELTATRLADAGAGPSTLVAVALPRDPDLVATLCALLKLGAACLPLDPGIPAGRLREIMADASPDVLVTTRAVAPAFTGDGPVLFLDDAPPTCSAVLPRHSAGTASEIAYVLYPTTPDEKSENSVVSYRDMARYLDDPTAGIPARAEILRLVAPLLSGGRLVLDADETRPRPVTREAPRDMVEDVVAQVWCAVLGVDRVGVRDRFFDLGGKSLAAVQVVARLRKLLGVELPLRALFDAPTVEELAARVRAEQAGGQGVREEAALEPVDRSEPLPLSFAQQRLWFLDRLMPDRAFYTMCDAFRVRGGIDLGALRRALRMLVGRHETLRTAFVERDGVPYQLVGPADGPGARRVAAPTRVDLSLLEPAEREEAVRNLVAAEARTPFRPADGALLRVVVARLADDDHVLVVSTHHIVSDAWSVGVLVDELGRLYRECVTGDPAALPPPAVQYADFAVWQRAWMAGPVQEEHLAYWKRALDGAPSVLRLPMDHPRPAVQSERGETVGFALPDALVAALEKLGREQGATLFMTLLGAFQVLLARHAGQEDIVVGVPAAGRTRTETEPLVGFFVNTLPLRAICAPGLSFRDLLDQVREAALGAFAHQDLPFEALVEALAPERDLGHNPLVQVTFQLLGTPAARPDLIGAEVERYPVQEAVSQFDLSLDIKRADDGSYRGILNYCPDLFDRRRMEVLVGHYLTLLGAAAADPGRPIGELPLSDGAERLRLLDGFGKRDAAYAGPGSVPERFAEVARTAPDARAVTCGATTLTFAELNDRVERLAQALLGAGVTRETPVAVRLPRSTDSVVALLAVMRAGGVYVPLDPDWPADRTAYILDDTAASVVITRDLPALPGRLHVDPRRPAADGLVPAPRIDPDQAAYVIYTSGSTGAPKGVVVRHRSLNHLTSALQATFLGHDPYLAGADGVPPGDAKLRTTLTAPFTFDASMEQLSWMLAGHELFIVPEDVRRDPSALVRFVREHRIDVIDTTSSQLELLVSHGLLDGEWAPSMVMVGGEAVSPSLWRTLRDQRRTRCFNLYGPTEATVDATCHDLSDPADVPVIGTPLPHTHVRVLDDRLRPVSVGVAGEIYLGGTGLARGYLNRPALTAQRFVADPYPDTPGSRLYRTGDRARWRPDGTLEYLGRTDDQIKIRGFRVEPGEIEAVLTHHPAVKEAAVVDDAHARLVAYVTLAEGGGAGPTDVRRFAQGRLPAHMVPSAVVVLEALPLTSNGKLDRARLPAPAAGRPELDVRFVAPRDMVEEVVAQVWCAVLGVDRVGVHDDFFELGGHSLLVVQVMTRIRKLLGVEVPLRELFDAATVEELAARVRAARTEGLGRGAAPPLGPVDRSGPLPLSFAQQRLWYLDQLAPDSVSYNMCDAYRVRGPLDLDALRRALRTLVERHETLRTAFVERDGVPHQVVSAPDAPAARRAAEVVRIEAAGRTDEAVRDLVAAEARTPFRPADGALMRVAVARLADDDHVLVVTTHHIVSDGWSVDILVDELGRLYREHVTGDSAGLPPLDVQYADFAVWQRSWMTGPVREEHLAYWKRALDGAPSVLRLPADHPRPAVQSQRGETVEFPLPAPLVARLEALCREQGVTLFMALFGAFQVLLARYSGQDDVVVGVPTANRTRAETEPLVGFFVNTLPVRVACSPELSFRALLDRVREAALGAFAHQDLPFEALVEALAPERDLGHHPLVQVTFQLLDAPDERLVLHGTDCVSLGFGGVTSRFDLSLDVVSGRRGKRCVLTYCPDLFDRPRMEVLAGHYLTLLGAAADDPGLRVGDLPLSDDVERLRLLGGSRPRYVPAPGAETVPDAFAAQVRATPDAPALVHGDSTLTFAELDTRVTALAVRLRRCGVAAETPVAVCLPRSADAVVALLAVLRAGGVYVPVDPEWPSGRVAHVLDETAAPVVITRDLPADPGRVHLDPRQAPAGDRDPLPRLHPDQAAYTIYTSGSTGTPKGVTVQHRSLYHLLGHVRRMAEGSPRRNVAHTTAMTFDPSLEQFLWLVAGHTLHVAPEEVRRDPEALVALVRRAAIDVLNVTPSHLTLLIEAGLLEGDRVPGTVLVGGEAVPAALWRTLRERTGATRFFNLYGPTEATVDATCHDLSDPADVPVIGTPLPHTHVRVLDDRLRPVSVGVAGEIYLGGTGLARGYLNRPALTAQRFVADPYPDTPGSRLYRTGDRARWRPDGTLEYLGRTDDQIKIRGFRVEPGEIEAVLTHHPAVKEAAVTVATDDGAARLVALVVPAPRAPHGDSADGAPDAQVEEWNAVFEATHTDAADGELTFNIKGWNDSLTGAPIPAEHMREWVDTTVARLLERPAERVLEIGSGTGLLMWRLLPHVTEYTGTDFSRPAVDWLRDGLRRRPAHRVRLLHREATDFTGVRAASTDLVVVNSVVQYFPDRAYLDTVLARALDATADRGRVFVGDVRNLALAPQFYARQALAHAGPGAAARDVARAAGEFAAMDGELLVSPAYFAALAARSPRVTGVEILPRRGRHRNEMSLYRYDVVLHVGGDRPAAPEAEVLTWGDQVHDLASLSARLGRGGPDALLVRGVANDRLTRDNELLDAPARTTAVEPEDLWGLADSTPYRVSVSWAAADPRGAMDVLLVRRDAHDDGPLLVPHPVPEPSAPLTNAPTRHPAARQGGSAADGLRSWLAERLPAHLLPARITEVDALPRTGTGKLDRGALGGLVTAGRGARAGDRPATAPRTGLERTLADAWARVLGLPEVGVHENFFALGGDSLLAVRAVARCRRAGVRLTVRQLLSEQTVAALAAALEEENHD
ncbi:non-ribosomal peptide synthetase [Streptomyces mobaraensis]|uniref:non-ribosomal peptide synthetase n=1 Tax=Streptomyces mobaraensis TaxID=35621 RepID=UPI00034C4157|nr:non-ribosomal peptide synthetase [Streptomyces mobaraensis]